MARPSRGALGDQVVLDRREQRKERGHDLRLGVALALDLDVLLERREGDAGLAGGVEDGDDPEERDLGADERAGRDADRRRADSTGTRFGIRRQGTSRTAHRRQPILRQITEHPIREPAQRCLEVRWGSCC